VPGKWTQILPEPEPEPHGGESSSRLSEVPVPRYAHQVVYDEGLKRVYMHGGNAGEGKETDEEKENEEVGEGQWNGGRDARDGVEGEGVGGSGRSRSRAEEDQRPRSRLREMRLDDFWVMKLIR
jgi:hypothetical protein